MLASSLSHGCNRSSGPAMNCERIRPLLSTMLDGEQPASTTLEHVDGCTECRSFLANIQTIRRTVRIEEVVKIPDVAPAVMAALPRHARRLWLAPVAGLAAGAVAGAVLVGGWRGPSPTLAAPLPEKVVAVQSEVHEFAGRFEITERLESEETRHYSGELAYRAPERLTLRINQVDGPPGWLDNSTELVVAGSQALVSQPFPCPTFDGCQASPRRDITVTGRDPFSSITVDPLDLVVPAGIFRQAAEPPALGERVIAGEGAVGVLVSASQARPLLDALFDSGNWREIHSRDLVEIWLHEDLFIPLALSVTAGAGDDRAAWAARRGYRDPLNVPYLELTYLAVQFEGVDPDPVEATGTLMDAGFRPGGVDEPPLDPGMPLVAGGRVEGSVDVEVWAWSDGRAWLRLDQTREWEGRQLFGNLSGVVRPVQLSNGTGYVSGDGSAVYIHGEGVDLVLIGSIEPDRLVELASQLPVSGSPAPTGWPEGDIASSPPEGVWLPSDLSPFLEPVVRVSESSTVVDLIGLDKRAIRLIQSEAAFLKPPIDPDAQAVSVRGTIGRYSPQLGALEWVEEGRVMTVSGSDFTLEELVAVANQGP